jgi:hypothetical protein
MDRGTGKLVREVSREGGGPPASSKSSTATRPHLVTSATRPSRQAEPPAEKRTDSAEKRTLKGFVKNGVVHLLEGELPENCFVRVTPE